MSESEGKKKYGKVEFQRGDGPGVRNQAYMILELTEKKKKERERERKCGKDLVTCFIMVVTFI